MNKVSLASLVLPISVIATALVTAFSAAPSWAGTLNFATNVTSHQQGTGIADEWRKETHRATGSYLKGYTGNTSNSSAVKNFLNGQNKDFLSLGVGGQAVFEFGTHFSGSVTLWETTWGEKSNQAAYDERVEVFVGNDLQNWLSIGTIQNIADNAYISSNGATLNINNNNTYKYVRLLDKSENKSGRDGFDVNAIAVRGVSVPEPTSVLGVLVFGTVAAGGLSKKKKTPKPGLS
jgi:hypothetical protein